MTLSGTNFCQISCYFVDMTRKCHLMALDATPSHIKKAERVSVDLSPPGKVREHIGTKNRNQVKNPTRNPTRFLLGRIRSKLTKEALVISIVLRKSNKLKIDPTRFQKIQQEYPT